MRSRSLGRYLSGDIFRCITPSIHKDLQSHRRSNQAIWRFQCRVKSTFPRSFSLGCWSRSAESEIRKNVSAEAQGRRDAGEKHRKIHSFASLRLCVNFLLFYFRDLFAVCVSEASPKTQRSGTERWSRSAESEIRKNLNAEAQRRRDAGEKHQKIHPFASLRPCAFALTSYC